MAGPTSAARLAAAAAVAALYVLAMRAAPVGAVQDDTLHILLARSLSHGAFALPDAAGLPAVDPLPGFAALLCLPARLVEPRWELLKAIGLLSAAAVLALTWRLGRRFLTEGQALSVLLLTALNPILVERAGLILPELPFLALSLLLFEALPAADSLGSGAWLAAGAALAALMRPEGALLVLALGLGVWSHGGWKRSAAFLLAALAPLALWTLRNHLLTGVDSGYLRNLGTEASRLAEPRSAFDHAAALLAALGGDGLLALRGLPVNVLACAGAAAAAAAAAGAARRLDRNPDARIFAMACYAILWAAQHLVWLPVSPRYIMPMVPIAWLLILAGIGPTPRRKALGPLLLAAAAAASLRLDLAAAAKGLRASARFLPATVDWIKDRTPADARLQSMEWSSLTVLTGRRTAHPPAADSRDEWLAGTLRQGAGYVLVDSQMQPDGYFPAYARRQAVLLEPWARSTPYARQVYRNDREGTAVYRIEHPDPARFLAAWDSFQAAGTAAREGKSPREVRADLDEAAALEPRLAAPWAVLAGLASDLPTRRRLLEKAARLDPTSELIASDLRRIPEAPDLLK